MSSSMRNAIQRRNHKERAQPQARQKKWGLLEKHKDYALRAADHREKRTRLKVLRDKARQRNPDEFHFGMMSARTAEGGVKIGQRGNSALSHDVVALLKTQDAGYLRTVLMRTRRERARVEGALSVRAGRVEVVGIKGGKAGKTLFVDSVEDQESYRKEGKDVEQASSDDDWEGFTDEDEDEPKVSSSQPQLLKKLQALRKRESELVVASQELDLQRAKMSNSIGGVNKNGVKFKIRERKR